MDRFYLSADSTTYHQKGSKMSNELYTKYLDFIQKNLQNVVVIDNKTLQIRGEIYKIYKKDFQFLVDALIDTDLLENIALSTVLELTKALQTHDFAISHLYPFFRRKTKKAIELFIALTKESTTELETKFLDELNKVA